MAIIWEDEEEKVPANLKWDTNRYSIQDSPNWSSIPEDSRTKVQTVDNDTGLTVNGTKAFNQFIPDSAHMPLSARPKPQAQPLYTEVPGAFASGANQSAAGLLGLPVDAVAGVMNLIPGVNINNPVGGSSWIKNNLLPKPYQPTRPAGTFAGAIGEQVPNAMLPGGPAAAGVKGGAQMFKAAVPSLVGSGLGVGAARTVAPGSAPAELAGAVLGGGLPAAATVVKNIPPELDKYIAKNLFQAIRPSNAGKNFASDIAKLEDKGVGAVKQIVYDARKRGVEPPKTLEEFGESIQSLRGRLFDQYSKMTQQTGAKGALIDLKPIVSELREVANDPVMRTQHPEVVAYANKLAERYAAQKQFTPMDAERAIAALNSTLKGYYAGRTSGMTEQKARALEGVATKLRQTLDKSIETYTGPGYQKLKNDYGQLRAIESDVVKRTGVHKRANKYGFFDLSDMFSTGKLVTGILKTDPATAAAGGAMLAVKRFLKRGNNPDKIVESIFKKVDKWLPEEGIFEGPFKRELGFELQPHKPEVMPSQRGLVPTGITRDPGVTDATWRDVTPLPMTERAGLLPSPRNATPIDASWTPVNRPGFRAEQMGNVRVPPPGFEPKQRGFTLGKSSPVQTPARPQRPAPVRPQIEHIEDLRESFSHAYDKWQAAEKAGDTGAAAWWRGKAEEAARKAQRLRDEQEAASGKLR